MKCLLTMRVAVTHRVVNLIDLFLIVLIVLIVSDDLFLIVLNGASDP